MRRVCLMWCWLVLLGPWLGATENADVLAHLRAGHPRLLLNEESLTAARRAAAGDPLRAAVHERILVTAESLLAAPVARHIPAGNDSLDQARYAVHTIMTCAFAYRLTGEVRFAERARKELRTVAAFPDWNPAHFLDVGETAFAVAVGYDWLHDVLPAEEREELRRAMVEKALRPGLTAYRSTDPKERFVAWARAMSNWNQVCNAGVLCAALALAEEEPELARDVIAGARDSIPRGLAAYAPDGEYPEGPGYWTFGTTYTVIALAALDGALGSDLGLSAAPGLAPTTDFPVVTQGTSGRMFNYADSTDDVQNSPARAWLAQRFGRATALRTARGLLAEQIRRETVTPFDPTIQAQVVNRFFPLHAVWFPTDPADRDDDLPLDVHLRGVADLAIFRGAWRDPRAVFVGFKAGENAARHNHLDLGSFVLDADGVRWAVDLGPDSYALPGFFDYKERRWNFLRTNNHGHNTVTPGGALQRRQVTAPIVAFGSTPARAYAVADLTPAYPDEAARLHRGVALLERARVLVQDEFLPTRAGVPLRWTMVTRAAAELGAGGRAVRLRSAGRELEVNLLEPAGAVFRIEAARPPTAAENQNSDCVVLVVAVDGSSEAVPVRVAVVFTPRGEDRPERPLPELQPLAEWR